NNPNIQNYNIANHQLSQFNDQNGNRLSLESLASDDIEKMVPNQSNDSNIYFSDDL
ncbi:MAG: hypothetical protein RLZZ361_423, partial [Cyanobacteriota bacterium]